MSEVSFYNGISVKELYENRDSIGKQEWIVDEIIPEGLTIIAGREKSGKSIVTKGSIAMAVALGTPVFGRYPTKRGTVLWFAMEESMAAIQRRVPAFFSKRNDQWYPPENLKIYGPDSIPAWTNKAIDAIEKIIAGYTDLALVVIDTLQHVVGTMSGGNQADRYAFEYHIGSQLQQLALKYKIAIIVVHHTVKSNTYNNKFDSIGGTAYTKACETMMVIEREGNRASVHVRGRTTPTAKIEIIQNPDTLLWVTSDSSQRQDSSRGASRKVNDLIVATVFGSDTKLRRRDIVQRCKSEDVSESSCDRWIDRQINSGNLRKDDDGNYVRCDAEPALQPLESNVMPAASGLFDDPVPAVSSPPPSLLHTEVDDGGIPTDSAVLPPAHPPYGNDGGGGIPTDSAVPPPAHTPYGNDGGGGIMTRDNASIATNIDTMFAGATTATPQDALGRLVKFGYPIDASRTILDEMVHLGHVRIASDGKWLIRMPTARPAAPSNTVTPNQIYTSPTLGMTQ